MSVTISEYIRISVNISIYIRSIRGDNANPHLSTGVQQQSNVRSAITLYCNGIFVVYVEVMRSRVARQQTRNHFASPYYAHLMCQS